MAGATHNSILSITILLAAVAPTGRDFGAVLLIADEANGTTLDGDRIRTYTTLASVQADNIAGFVSAGILAAAVAAFSQTVQPNSIKIGRKAVAEAYDVALAAIEAVDPDFYGVAIESRAAADQLLVGAVVEASATRRLFFLQSSDATILTAGFPAALSPLDGNERSVLVYHDTDTEWYDFAYPINRLAFSVDTNSVVWANFELKGVANYATPLTDTQRQESLNNKANPGLGLGGSIAVPTNFVPFRGVNLNGRNIKEIVTADWFESRLRDRVVTLVLTEGNAGRIIPVSPQGQAQLGGEAGAQGQIGITAGHFSDFRVTYPTITDADRAAELIRVEGVGVLVVGGKEFDYTFNFQTDPLTE